MKTMSAREAKNAFGLMINSARAALVLLEKHGHSVVMVIAGQEYARFEGVRATANRNMRRVAHERKLCLRD
jgi:hypothetical protein